VSSIDEEALAEQAGVLHSRGPIRLRDEAPATIPCLPKRVRLYCVRRLKFLLFTRRVCGGEAQPLAGVVD
jgi:hypothetical protein